VTILIAGVGYIGAPLALEYLARGESVVGLENFFCTRRDALAALRKHPNFRLIRGSVSSEKALDATFAEGPFQAIHLLAAQPSSSPKAAPARYTEETNLIGARMLLDRASASGAARVVFGSSFHVYGAPLTECVDETHPLGSFSDLSHLSKIYVEKLLEMYTRSSDISGVSVRLGIVYGLGPVMKSDPLFITVPNLFARRAAQGQPLRVNPTATAAMAFLHVEDAVSALLAACELQSRYADANAVSEALSVSQVALAVRDAASDRGLNVHIEPEPRPGDPTAPFTVSSRLQTLGWAPSERLRDRVGEVIDYAQSDAWADR